MVLLGGNLAEWGQLTRLPNSSSMKCYVLCSIGKDLLPIKSSILYTHLEHLPPLGDLTHLLNIGALRRLRCLKHPGMLHPKIRIKFSYSSDRSITSNIELAKFSTIF